jgi:hypothetical protein
MRSDSPHPAFGHLLPDGEGEKSSLHEGEGQGEGYRR